MTPSRRTPQQRDRRFARVRRITHAVLLTSGVVSATLIGYVASVTKPVAKVTVSAPVTTSTPTTTGTAANATSSSSSSYTPPTTVPVTTTTVCTSTPSGTVTCY